MSETETLKLRDLSGSLLSTLKLGADTAILVALSSRNQVQAGNRILVTQGSAQGTLGDSRADQEALAMARRALAGDPALLPGTYSVHVSDGQTVDVFLETHHPAWELVIVGAGHVAQPLATLGSLLGLRVTVLDDRPEFATRERFPEADFLGKVDFADPFAGIQLHRWSHVVLVTRGHKYDYECLKHLLVADCLPGYIGMIGSRRRVRATFDALLREGVPRDRLEVVHAPIGLDIGSETPAEIALSVAAELVHHWRGGTGRPLMEMERILDRFQPTVSAEEPDLPEGSEPEPPATSGKSAREGEA